MDTYGNQNVPKNVQGIVSYSLFGDYKKYSEKLLESIKIIPNMLPNWYARVYAGVDSPKEIIQKLVSNGAQVYIMGPNPSLGFEGALWRFGPASELLPFISLDADNLFDKRIAYNTKAWMKSNKQFIKLSKRSLLLPLEAGLWGARPFQDAVGKPIPVFENIQNHINMYCEHWYGFDEAYLKTNIWPLFKKYGYYQCRHYHLIELCIGGIILILIAMVYSVYLATKVP